MSKPRRAVLLFVAAAAAVCFSGCGGGGSAASVMPAPGARASPPASPSPPPGPLSAASYAGCQIFPAGDVYNAQVTNAGVDPGSAALIASVAALDGSGFVLSTGVEHVNLASPSTATLTVKATASYHQNEWNANPAWPWASGYAIEPLGDAHAIVLRTSDCRLFESYGTGFSSGVLSAYSGWSWDLSQPFVQLNSVLGGANPSSMASGLSLFAGAIKSEELQAGVIRHALNWDGPAHAMSQWTFVPPASDTDGLTYSGSSLVQLPYGAHLRLKSSFNDSALGPQAKAISTALKTYGMVLADTGCCNTLYGIEAQNGSSVWNSGDLASLGQIHITDFDVLTLPAIQRVAGH
jgi:hypothetical protein